jgi:hypothetical protein
MKVFVATLTDPSGCQAEYTVRAFNKTEARNKIATIYRNDTGPASAGFYSFSQNRLKWESWHYD